MHRDLLSALVANVRKRAAEGDCPVTPSYPVETLENAILDLAAEAPAEGSGEREEIAHEIYDFLNERFPDGALPGGVQLFADAGDHTDVDMKHEAGCDELAGRILALRARSSAPEAREAVGWRWRFDNDLSESMWFYGHVVPERPENAINTIVETQPLYTHPAALSADHAELTRLAEAAGGEALGNLLAVIHGDGGHRALEVGTKQAALEAEKIVANLLSSAPEARKGEAVKCRANMDTVGDCSTRGGCDCPPQQRELRDVVKGIDADYMTSETHHPGYVLIPAAKFDAIVGALREEK